MSNKNLIQEKFLQAYDVCADDIFEYCYTETQQRDIAKHLTRNIFNEAWNNLVFYGLTSVSTIKKIIYRTANDTLNEFMSAQQSRIHYYDNLWNLTLSQ